MRRRSREPRAMTMPSRGQDYRHSLAEELRRAVAEAPDVPFLRMMTGEWTYRRIDDESTRIAHGLRRLGVTRGDNVSLMLPNCVEFLVVWLALAKLGAVTAPVNT